MSNPSRTRLAEPQSASPLPSSAATGLAPAKPLGSSGGSQRAAGPAGVHGSAHAGARKHCPVCAERYPADFRVCPRDATALDLVSSDSDPLVGVVLADTYDVLGMIGEGATGRVYEARHIRLRAKRYAIKVMYSDLTRQPAVVERFLREAEATSALSHPNVVSALDVGQTLDSRPYIVSELLQGVQLGDYLARCGRLSVAEAVYIVRQACQALIAAHDKGIVHRDIKPGNLFLVGEPGAYKVKVLDFGISLIGDASLTKTGMVMGTPAYMPPEQASGTRVDHRADIYSLATVMYEALTGSRAFSGADPIATLANVLTRDPARPRSLNAEIPPELELVIQRAMSKLPSQRYRSMREFDAALAGFDVGPAYDFQDAELTPGGSQNAASADLDADHGLACDVDLDSRLVRAEQPARFSRHSIPLPGSLARMVGAADSLDQSRVKLVWFAWALGVTLLLGLIDATTSAIRLSHDGAALTGAELVLSTIGPLGLLVMPSLLFAHYIATRVWSSTPRVVETSRRIRRVLYAALVTYAGGMLLVRVLAGVLSNATGGAMSTGWGLVLFAAAALVGIRTGWLELRHANRANRADRHDV